MLTADMKAIVDSSKLGFVATVCEDGSPNLSPKGSIRVYDEDHLVFADIASPATVENLRRDPRVEINCVDFLRRRGYRFKGTAEVIEPGDNPAYREIAGWLRKTHGPDVPAHHAVLVHVEQARAVDSPAYTILGAREEDLIGAWTTKYMNAGAALASRNRPSL
jgi:uncharacterized protein